MIGSRSGAERGDAGMAASAGRRPQREGRWRRYGRAMLAAVAAAALLGVSAGSSQPVLAGEWETRFEVQECLRFVCHERPYVRTWRFRRACTRRRCTVSLLKPVAGGRVTRIPLRKSGGVWRGSQKPA